MSILQSLRGFIPGGSPVSQRSERSRETLQLMEQRVPRRTQSTTRIAHEEEWVKCCAFLGGKQHFALVGNQIVDVPARQHEVRYRANFIKPAVARAVAKILNLQGRAGVVPEGPGMMQREDARTTEIVLDHLRAETDYQLVKLYAYLWACACGTSFIKNTFDPNQGIPDRFYWLSEQDHSVVPAVMLTPEQRQERDLKRMFDDLEPGEVCTEATSPFQIHPDPASKVGIKECRFISQHQWVPRSVVAEAFGVDEDELQVEAANSSVLRYEEALASMASGIGGWPASYGDWSKEMNDRAWLTQCWERPSRKYPRGRYIATTGNRVLRDEDNPYIGDRTRALHLPFTKVDWFPAPGRFWSYSLVSDLTSPQFRRNESRGRMFSYEGLFANTPMLAPTGCGISGPKMTTAFGPVYDYNPANGEPKPLQLPTLPPEVAGNAAMCEHEIMLIASQSDVDGGKLPGQLRSGDALETMQGERDMALTITQASSLRVDRDCAKQWIALAKLYYDSERIAMYRGQNGQWASKVFLASTLSSNVRILGEPGEIETSKSFRRALGDMIGLGGLQPATNPQHMQLVLKSLRYHTSDELVDDFLQHEMRQEKELRTMIASPEKYREQPYPILPFEDDEAHARVLVRFFHSDEWERLDPFTQSVLLQHYELHSTRIEEKRVQEVMLMQATQSTPAAKGSPSPPGR